MVRLSRAPPSFAGILPSPKVLDDHCKAGDTAPTTPLPAASAAAAQRATTITSAASPPRQPDGHQGISPSAAPSCAPCAPTIVVLRPGSPEKQPSLSELQQKRDKLQRHRLVCSKVVDGLLFVSGQDVARDAALLAASGITHVLNCAGPHCPNFLEGSTEFSPPLEFLRLDMFDHRSEDISWFMYAAFDFIAAARQKHGRVLVHCVQGVSRSCALAIAWVMLSGNVGYEQAYTHVRQRRGICAPNTGFMCALLEWQKRRQRPPTSPFLLRTGWHVPFFPGHLLLKLCIREEDRTLIAASPAALDPRACFVVAVPAAVAVAAAAATAAAAAAAAAAAVGEMAAEASGEEVRGAAPMLPPRPAEKKKPPMLPPRQPLIDGTNATRAALVGPVACSDAVRCSSNGIGCTGGKGGGGGGQAGKLLFVWQGRESTPAMLELALRGVRWLEVYEEGFKRALEPHALVVQQGRETPFFWALMGVEATSTPLRAAAAAGGNLGGVGRVAAYKDLEPESASMDSMDIVSAAAAVEAVPMDVELSAAPQRGEPPAAATLSTQASIMPAAVLVPLVPRGAAEHLEAPAPPLQPNDARGEGPWLLECVQAVTCEGAAGASGSGSGSQLLSPSAAASGLRWSRLAVYDDEDLQEDACFLLVTSAGRCFAWVGKSFAAEHFAVAAAPASSRGSGGGGDVARNFLAGVAPEAAHAALLSKVDFGLSLDVVGAGAEGEEFWRAFEAGY